MDYTKHFATRLRRLFTRVALDDTEVQMLRGILNQLAAGGGPEKSR